MNKTFFFAAALTAALVSGQNARSEQIFQTKNTFTLAKAVKLGRARISAFDQIGTLTESSSLSKGCSSSCYTCDTSTGTCTVCKSGYYLNGSGGCTSCPANATCDGSSAYTCTSGYYDSGSGCSACTTTGTCTGSNGGSSSSSSSSSSSCTATTGYTCVNGVKTACYYSTCASCATDTLKCISCQSGYTLSGSNCI